ncbi:MAG: DUF4384 domain-containing protein [Bacteroidales bacterium]|nr:DUF4384 domain-containing protein [Bacteroidales bacterium]
MRKYFLTCLVLVFAPVLLFSQKSVKVTGTAQVEFPDNMTRQDVKNHAQELATIDALEKAFGRVVIQGNSTYLSNVQTGKQTETKSVFNTIANTSVKGEVLNVINVEFTDLTGTRTIEGKKETYVEMKCDIEIEAREITTPPVNFMAYTLNCTDERCKTTDFRIDDPLYMFFSSPSSGYISIFLDEDGNTQCLYPYNTMPAEFEGGVPVAADKKYILFSEKPEFNYFKGKKYITPYLLYTTSPRSINRLFIIFSKQPLNKPSLSDVQVVEGGYKLPRSLKSEDFQRWLNKYRSYEKANVEVDYIDITITK